MLSIDLKNAFDSSPGYNATNFTCLLLRLIAKADSENLEKLRKGFPVEVKAVEIYKGDCPYVVYGGGVDWNKIENLAYGRTRMCPECGGKGFTESVDGDIRCGTCKESK